MIVELTTSWLDIANLIIGIFSFIALVVYAYFTYHIARDSKDPLVSFSLHKIEDGSIGHINFIMINKSRIEVEVWSKVWIKINEHTFSCDGFYGNKTPWILQPFTQGSGHFKLGGFEDEEGVKLSNFLKQESVSSANLNIQIKYRRIDKRKWKKSSVHKYFYDFQNERFWLDV